MGVPNLSDGVPLTYEWLNQIADAINKLEVQNSDDSNVKFVGKITGQDIQVLTGEERIEVTGTQKAGASYKINNIEFSVPFLEAPTVIAMVQSSTKTKDDIGFAAGVVVGNITNINFDAVVQLFNDSSNLTNKKFYIKYIAIGKKQVFS